MATRVPKTKYTLIVIRFPPLWSGETTRCAVLIPTELVKLIECRTDLPSVLGSWVNVPQAVEQRGIFGPEFALQIIYVLGQLFNLLGVLLPTSLGELHTETSNFVTSES
jgi:hypothetical protein